MTIKEKLYEIFKDVIFEGNDFDTNIQQSEYADWDSLKTVSLISVIVDEFGEVVTIEDIDSMNSFMAVLEIIESRK